MIHGAGKEVTGSELAFFLYLLCMQGIIPKIDVGQYSKSRKSIFLVCAHPIVTVLILKVTSDNFGKIP